MRIKTLAIVLGALTLGACAHDGPNGMPYMGGPDNFGEANKTTMLAQVIDPAPHYDTDIPESHAEQAGWAVERYRKHEVKLPERTRTTDAFSESGGGK